MQLLTYLHDPDNLYLPLIEALKLPSPVQNITIAVSPSTTPEIKNIVAKLGTKIIEGGLYGTARINLLKDALRKNTDDTYFLCDFDKLIHWLNVKPEEFNLLLNSNPTADLTVIARSTRATSTYPETWIQTESIATRILAKIIKQRVDFMNGPVIVNKKAADVIINNAKETGVGSCAEFCLLVNQAGLSIENREIDGLTWEDPDRYKKMIETSASYDDWKYETYNSLYEWRKRVDFLHTQVAVMIRLSQEPINPKYPMVHNKTLESA